VTVNVNVSQWPGTVVVQPAGWDRTLLADVGIVDLDAHPIARLDPLIGLVTRKERDA
jgi:hypothetical protein